MFAGCKQELSSTDRLARSSEPRAGIIGVGGHKSFKRFPVAIRNACMEYQTPCEKFATAPAWPPTFQSTAGPTSDAASATDEMKMDQSDRKPVTMSIKGEVLRVEGSNYVVKEETGKEVSLHTDSTTEKTGDITEGYRIEALVARSSNTPP
jgi:hypothetical protein